LHGRKILMILMLQKSSLIAQHQTKKHSRGVRLKNLEYAPNEGVLLTDPGEICPNST